MQGEYDGALLYSKVEEPLTAISILADHFLFMTKKVWKLASAAAQATPHLLYHKGHS